MAFGQCQCQLEFNLLDTWQRSKLGRKSENEIYAFALSWTFQNLINQKKERKKNELRGRLARWPGGRLFCVGKNQFLHFPCENELKLWGEHTATTIKMVVTGLEPRRVSRGQLNSLRFLRLRPFQQQVQNLKRHRCNLAQSKVFLWLWTKPNVWH